MMMNRYIIIPDACPHMGDVVLDPMCGKGAVLFIQGSFQGSGVPLFPPLFWWRD